MAVEDIINKGDAELPNGMNVVKLAVGGTSLVVLYKLSKNWNEPIEKVLQRLVGLGLQLDLMYKKGYQLAYTKPTDNPKDVEIIALNPFYKSLYDK